MQVLPNLVVILYLQMHMIPAYALKLGCQNNYTNCSDSAYPMACVKY